MFEVNVSFTQARRIGHPVPILHVPNNPQAALPLTGGHLPQLVRLDAALSRIETHRSYCSLMGFPQRHLDAMQRVLERDHHHSTHVWVR